MNIEEAKRTAEQSDRRKSGPRLHLRLPNWKQGWTTAPFGYQGSAKSIMGLFQNGNFYGYVLVDPVELISTRWEIVQVVETGNNTDTRPDAATDLLTPPHKFSPVH